MKIKLITKKGLVRIGILLIVLLAAGVVLVRIMFRMPGKSFAGTPAPFSAEEESMRAHLEAHVQKLAQEIGERNYFLPDKLEAAAAYVESELRSIGLTAGADKGDRFNISGLQLKDDKLECRNVCAELPGTDAAAPLVVVGAHYDSVRGSPGANDNGTGVAVLLEVARALKGRSFPRTVRFVAFANEEPPFFKTQHMGSLVHAKACKTRGERIHAMISLETLGCYTSARRSQRYPPPLGLLYPDQGNFVGFVGNLSGQALVKDAIRVFRDTAQIPSEGAATLGWIPGVDWSDHWSFWKQGYPAFMVTDTAVFRYPEYHTRKDTVDQIDFASLTRVTSGITRVVAHLASGAGR